MSPVEPHLTHRMADPRVRARAALILAILLALTWGIVRAAGGSSGPFSSGELRDLSGVPIPPPQIETRFAPQQSPLDDLPAMIRELQRIIEGVEPPAGLGGESEPGGRADPPGSTDDLEER